MLFDISDENSADQKSGYHEKYVDADIAARYLPAKCVVGNDRGHRDGTQALYIRAEVEGFRGNLHRDVGRANRDPLSSSRVDDKRTEVVAVALIQAIRKLSAASDENRNGLLRQCGADLRM